jgi:hypothetical protein
MADYSDPVPPRLYASIVIVTTAASLLGCGGSDHGGAGEASEAARAYVEAYDRRDGKAICDSFTDELREHLVRRFEEAFEQQRKFTCADLVKQFIGYQEESDTAKFEHVEVVSALADVDGSAARVHVHERYRFSNVSASRATPSLRDVIHLVERDGRWRVAKLGGIYYYSLSAYQIPASVLDPPVTGDEAARGAPLPSARGSCTGQVVYSIADPAGEAPPPLDLRRVTARVDAEGNVCLGVTLAANPRPATMVTYRIEQPVAGSATFHVAEFSVRIGHGGALHVAGLSRRHAEAGAVDGELMIFWRARQDGIDGREPFRLEAWTSSLQEEEPLVRDPLDGRDDAASEANAPRR